MEEKTRLALKQAVLDLYGRSVDGVGRVAEWHIVNAAVADLLADQKRLLAVLRSHFAAGRAHAQR